MLSLHIQLKLFKLFNVDTKGDFCKNITDIDVFLAFLTLEVIHMRYLSDFVNLPIN